VSVAAFKRSCLAAVVASFCVGAAASHADHAPSYVMPNPRGIPLFVDGVEVSGAVIEGDWGLTRPGAVAPTIYPNYSGHGPVLLAPPAGYFPETGRPPRSGRDEATPPPGPPRRAQSYSRQWSVESGPGPATTYTPFDPPQVIEAAPYRRHHDRRPRRPRHAH
jgi:hypothetical protein